jgi:hypothetical protein
MKITQIVALVSATAFILTVAYIYGFSRSIDVNLHTYFSTNDYIKLSVYWLPRYIFAFFTGICLSEFTTRFFGTGSSLEDKIAKRPNISACKKFLLKHEEMIRYIGILGAIVVGIIYIAFRFAPKHAFHICYCLLGMGLWAAYCTSLLLPSLTEKWTRWQKQALLWGPTLIIGVYTYGIFAGVSELDKVDKYPTARLEMTSEASNKKGRVLFALTQYIVFLEQKTKMVEIIPVGQVKNIIPIPEDKGKAKKNKK